MFLSCPAKKGTKECGLRGAEAGRSRAQSRPLKNPPARTWHPLEQLNGQNLLHVPVLLSAAAAALAALPIFSESALWAKKSEHFLPKQDRS